MLLDLVELAAPPGLWPRLGRPLLRTGAQIVPDIVLCVADSFGSMPRSLRLSTKARVMYRRLATTSPGRGFQGVPMTIFSAFSFQRLPSTFRRSDRAKTAPFSNPMMCSSPLSDFPQPNRSAPAVVEFREIRGFGLLIASPNVANARCVFTPFES